MTRKKARINLNGIPVDVVEVGPGIDGVKTWKCQLPKIEIEKLPEKPIVLGHTKEGIGLDHGDIQRYNKKKNKIEQLGKKNVKTLRIIPINQIADNSTSFSFIGTAVVGAYGQNLSGTSTVMSEKNVITAIAGSHASGTLVVGKVDESFF